MDHATKMTLCLLTAMTTVAAEADAEDRAVLYANQPPPGPPQVQPVQQALPPWAGGSGTQELPPPEVPSDLAPGAQGGRLVPTPPLPMNPLPSGGLVPGMIPGLPGGDPAGGGQPGSPMFGPSRPMRDMSYIFFEAPPARKIKVHDLITVIVNENSEVVQNSRFNRQRNARLEADLRQFVRINSQGNLDNAALEAPSISTQLQSQLQAYGQGLSQEGMRYRITATVMEVLPNGTLILEARKSLRTNRDLWEYKLTGRIRGEDVAGNNTVQSESIADLNIIKSEFGKIRDSSKRGILMTLYDWFLPF